MTSYAFADLITFTRSTTATYVNASGNIASAAINTHRIDYDPVALTPRGLLIEEQRTNLITYSEQIDNAAWTKNAATVTANAATSPDGTTNADKVVPNTTNNIHGVYRTETYGAGTFTFSFYAKADGYPRVGVRSYDGTSYFMRATFDLSAGTVVSATGGTASIQAAGNGWYRCVVTATTAGNMGSVVGTWIEPLPAGQLVQASYTGDGTSGTLVYGGQLEAGSFATSYIPTVASQVTRTADVATITGANFSQWYNQSEGTFVSVASSAQAGAFNVTFEVKDATSAERFGQGIGASGSTFYVIDNNVSQVSTNAGAVAANSIASLSSAYKVNDFAAVLNGGTVGTDTNGTLPTVDRMILGNSASNIYLNGHIRSIKYYPTRLTNAQLQALSA